MASGKEKSDQQYLNVKGIPMDLLVYISEICPTETYWTSFPVDLFIICLVLIQS